MAAEIPDGAFIVARAIFNSSLWTMSKDDKLLAVTLIGMANWKDRKWFDGKAERLIKRGQLVRSMRKLAKEAGLSYQECRTSMRNLQRVGFLTQQSTSHYTIITLTKYDKYQDLTKYADREWPDELTQLSTRGQRTPNAMPTQPQRTLNDKQEGEEREERKEGEESAPAPRSGSLASHLASAYLRMNPGVISQLKATQLIDFAIARGVKADALEIAINDPARSRGFKLWEVVDPLAPDKRTNGKSVVQQIIDKWAVEDAAKAGGNHAAK